MRRLIAGIGASIALVALVVAPGTAQAVPVSSQSDVVEWRDLPGGHRAAVLTATDIPTVQADGSVTTSRIEIWPAFGAGFAVGTDDAAWVTTERPGVRPHDHLSVRITDFGYGTAATCVGVASTAAVTVLQASYDASGTLTAFAAHVSFTCPGTGSTFEHDLRLGSDVPLSVAGFIADIAVNPSVTRSGNVSIRNAGTVPLTLGAMSVSDVPTGWTASLTAGGCSATLAANSACSAHVAFSGDGTPGSVELHVATPDGPTAEITTWLHPLPVMPTPTVRTVPLSDGVLVAWDNPVTAYPAVSWSVFRSDSPAGPWGAPILTYSPRYADSLVPSGVTEYYYVEAHPGSTAFAPATSAVVGGAGLDAPITSDGITDLSFWSASAGARQLQATTFTSAFADVPEGPGTYLVPDEVPIGSLVVGSTPCQRPTGTLVVRDLAHQAFISSGYDALLRLDASFTGTCHGGLAVRGELRKGTPGRPFDRVVSFPAQPDPLVWVHTTGTVSDVVRNDGTTTVSLGAPSIDAGAHQSQWSVSTTCGTTLAPGAECFVDSSWMPLTVGTQSVIVHVPGASLTGALDLAHTLSSAIDSTPPTLAPLAAPPIFVDDRRPYAYAPAYSDSQSGPDSRDSRYRVASATATALSTWRYPSGAQGERTSTDVGIFLRLAPGQLVCSSSRARDLAGNTTPWTSGRCTSLVWDDAGLTDPRGTWGSTYAASQATYNSGTWHRATARGATLVGPTVRARRVAVLVTTCPTCGSLDVYAGSTFLGRLTTRTNRIHHRVMLALPVRSVAAYGRLRLVVHSSGLPVIVDGIGARIA